LCRRSCGVVRQPVGDAAACDGSARRSEWQRLSDFVAD
jgi:hypothetical protein